MGVAVMSWISLQSQWAIASGAMKLVSKETSVESCAYSFVLTNSSVINPTQMIPVDDSEINPLFRISYMWYTILGALITIITALSMTLVLGRNNTDTVDHSLISPIIRRYYRNIDGPSCNDVKLQSFKVKGEEEEVN